MASLVAKTRIVHQSYLGSAEKAAALVKDRTSPIPLAASCRDYGLQTVSRRLLAYDATNFHTGIASTNTRSVLAPRGHNKQGRHNLRPAGLSYVMDTEHGLSLCHHVDSGNTGDVGELSPAPRGRVGHLSDFRTRGLTCGLIGWAAPSSGPIVASFSWTQGRRLALPHAGDLSAPIHPQTSASSLGGHLP